MMEAEFNRISPAQLTSEDCDRLIALVEAVNSAQSA
jgi:hypothetical protein